jgi:hypothetical protein
MNSQPNHSPDEGNASETGHKKIPLSKPGGIFYRNYNLRFVLRNQAVTTPGMVRLAYSMAPKRTEA